MNAVMAGMFTFLKKHRRMLQALFGFGLLFWLISRVEIPAFTQAFGQIRIVPFLVVSMLLIPVLIFLPAASLFILFRGMGNTAIRFPDIGKHIPLIECMALCMPGRLGDFGFLYLLREKAAPHETLTAIVIHKFISLAVIAVFAVIGLSCLSDVRTAAILCAAAGGCGAACLFVFYNRRCTSFRKTLLNLVLRSYSGKIRGFDACSKKLVKSPALLAVSAVLAVVVIAIGTVYWKACMVCAGRDATLQTLFFMLVAIRVVSILPVSVWSLGTGESVMLLILGRMGIPPESVLAVSFSQRMAYIGIVVIFLGLFNLFKRHSRVCQ